MKLISKNISRKELSEMARKSFGNIVKAVVDTDKKIMAVDASLHADEEAYLLSKGSKQSDLWGINLYPELQGDDFVEFDSMINLRPNQENSTRGVDDPNTQAKIRSIIQKLVRSHAAH